MTTQEQVTQLEAILARVNGRRNAPRPLAPVPIPPAASEPAVAAASPGAATPAPSHVEPIAAKAIPEAPKTPTPVSEPVARSASTAPSADVDVEVEEGMAEVDLDDLENDEAAASSLSDSVADLLATGGADELEELPASSRRPIQLNAGQANAAQAGEAGQAAPEVQAKREEDAFESASPAPPHPVPPESGRQVASPIADFEGDLSGVRSVTSMEAPAPAESATAVVATPPVDLKATLTRPVVAAASPAVFHGQVPEFKPTTFGELLDATLAL